MENANGQNELFIFDDEYESNTNSTRNSNSPNNHNNNVTTKINIFQRNEQPAINPVISRSQYDSTDENFS